MSVSCFSNASNLETSITILSSSFPFPFSDEKTVFTLEVILENVDGWPDSDSTISDSLELSGEI